MASDTTSLETLKASAKQGNPADIAAFDAWYQGDGGAEVLSHLSDMLAVAFWIAFRAGVEHGRMPPRAKAPEGELE